MYHCHICFYLLGKYNNGFEIIKNAIPLEHFAHEFCESDKLEKEFINQADVIIANLKDMDVKETLEILVSKKKETELKSDKTVDSFPGHTRNSPDWHVRFRNIFKRKALCQRWQASSLSSIFLGKHVDI